MTLPTASADQSGQWLKYLTGFTCFVRATGIAVGNCLLAYP
ncbi:MAG: hypothetical protein QOH63_4141 [Acidobacteriota bacterium]|jgi:hypothetical protein|nr:hypothetical protein [Acidobacteriota bacterium]